MLRFLIVILSLLVAGIVAANPQATDPTRDILVTFDNSGARASTTGAPYRARKRYAIGADAQRHATAIAREYGIHQVDHWPIRSLSVYCFVYRARDHEDRKRVIEALRGDKRVESVQVLQEFETGTNAMASYDDTYAELQHGLNTLNLTSAHRHSLGAGVRVAIVDGHADLDHEDLRGRIGSVEDFAKGNTSPDRHHGTAVTSVIAAHANNAKGIVGVAPQSTIELYVACWSSAIKPAAVCDTFSLAKALDTMLENPPQVLNLSLVGPPDPLLQRLLRKAHDEEIIIVAARPAGVAQARRFPASMDEVIDVGSSTLLAEGSRGPLYAPGEQILVAIPGNDYEFRSGSSLAAAHVSGVVALLLAIEPGADHTAVMAALTLSQRQPDGRAFSVDACKALQVASPKLACDP